MQKGDVLDNEVLKARVLKHIKNLKNRASYLQGQRKRRAKRKKDPDIKGYMSDLKGYKLETDGKLIDNITLVIRRDPAQLELLTNLIKDNEPLENIRMGFLLEANAARLADKLFPHTQKGKVQEINAQLDTMARAIHDRSKKPEGNDPLFWNYLILKDKIKKTLVHKELKEMLHAPAQLTDLNKLATLVSKVYTHKLPNDFIEPKFYFSKKDIHSQIKRYERVLK